MIFPFLLQIYLLMTPPSRTSMFVFRVNMHFLHGATLALLLPVVNTRVVGADSWWILYCTIFM